MPPHARKTFARLLAGLDAEGDDLEALPPEFRPIGIGLAGAPLGKRQGLWDSFLRWREDAFEVIAAIAGADLDGPPREPEALCATLADLRRAVGGTTWLWPQWLAAGTLCCVASDPGAGKTRLLMALLRSIYFGLPWPDGAPQQLPAGSRFLWGLGDRQFSQLLDAAPAFGLPDESFLLAAPPQNPTGVPDLDLDEEVEALRRQIESYRPPAVILDTIGGLTSRKLGRPEEARVLLGGLADLAATTGTLIIMVTHLSKDGDALGRRIEGFARTVIKLVEPDPEGEPGRLRVAVTKSAWARPPALGATHSGGGFAFDASPPEPSPAGRPGRKPQAVQAAAAWLRERLSGGEAKVVEIRKEAEAAGISAKALYGARDHLGIAEYEQETRRGRALKVWCLPGGVSCEIDPARNSPRSGENPGFSPSGGWCESSPPLGGSDFAQTPGEDRREVAPLPLGLLDGRPWDEFGGRP
jgi:hypothetical protein